MTTKFTPGGVSYEEIEGSPTFDVRTDDITATRQLRIPWNQIDRLIKESFPAVPVDPQNPPWTIPPNMLFPGIPYLEVDSLHIEPFDGGNPGVSDLWGVSTFKEGAVVDITYRRLISGFRHDISTGGEFMTLPNSGFRWDSQDSQERIENEELKLGKLVPTVEHTITYEKVPSPPWDAISARLGCVNIDRDATLDAPSESLLFLGLNASQGVSVGQSTLSETWTLSYRFSQRVVNWGQATDIGWNEFYRPDTGLWENVFDSNGEPPFKLISFDELYKPDGS